MKNTPLWSKEVAKCLIDRGMNKKELAAELHVNYQQMCSVLSGYVDNKYIANRICEYLGVQA